ncbi:MAG: hypothetical protein Q4G63_09990 [Bacteroidia bacterium]|nr:hypothetical protein [Bacteroidia bacterium]
MKNYVKHYLRNGERETAQKLYDYVSIHPFPETEQKYKRYRRFQICYRGAVIEGRHSFGEIKSLLKTILKEPTNLGWYTVLLYVFSVYTAIEEMGLIPVLQQINLFNIRLANAIEGMRPDLDVTLLSEPYKLRKYITKKISKLY